MLKELAVSCIEKRKLMETLPDSDSKLLFEYKTAPCGRQRTATRKTARVKLKMFQPKEIRSTLEWSSKGEPLMGNFPIKGFLLWLYSQSKIRHVWQQKRISRAEQKRAKRILISATGTSPKRCEERWKGLGRKVMTQIPQGSARQNNQSHTT